MLDKKQMLYQITKNKRFNINVSEPFNHKSIDFLSDFSKELKKEKKIYKFPDLFYLIFWSSYKKIGEAKKKLLSNNI